MKRNLAAFFLVWLMLFSVTACGSSSSTSTDSQDSTSPLPTPIAEEDIPKMYANPESYIGGAVTMTGQIFGGVEYDENAVYFQMWGDPDNSDFNTVVTCPDPELELENGQYIRIQGVVADVFEGQNMMGGTIIAPAIRADLVEVLSYKDAVHPTVATAVPATGTIEQYGYAVTVETVELAEEETRAYISVTNNGSSAFSLYDFNMLLIQNGTQYESQINFNADYPELQDDLRPGIKTEGVVVFPAIEQTSFQLIMEGRSDNWHEDLQEYVFDLTIQ